MKNPIKNIVLLSGAALLSLSNLSAVETDPVGFVTLTINGSPDGTAIAYTGLSAPMQLAASAAGALTSTPTSAVVENTGAAYGVNDFAGTDAAGNYQYYLQFTSGTSNGESVDIVSNTATTITTASDLTGLASSGDTYTIKKYLSISDVFGAANETGFKSGGDSGASDIIYLMSTDGAGSYATYYYQTDVLGFLGGDGWRAAGDQNTPYDDVVVGPDDGILISRDATGDLTRTLAGSVNVADLNRGLPAGYSLVSYPYPVDVTLDESGIYTASNGYVSGGDSGASDLVYIINSNGTFASYYRQTDVLGFLGGDGWRAAGDQNTVYDDEVIPAGSSVIIFHTGTGLQWADAKPF